MKLFLLFLFCASTCFSQGGSFVCKFDKAGKRKSCTQKHMGARGWEKRVLHYDENGRVTRIDVEEESASEEDPGYENKQVYDAKGLLLKSGNTKYTYNSEGQLVSMVYHIGITAFENTFLYANKMLTTGFFREEDGMETVYYNTKFAQKPLIQKDSLTWELKEAFLDNRIDSIFAFDKKGKLTSAQRWYYDQSGHRVKRVEWGTATNAAELDKELVYLEQWKNNLYLGYTLINQVCGGGKIISTKKFDANGKLLYDSTKQK